MVSADDLALVITAPLTLKRRGVETRLQLGVTPSHPDPKLEASLLNARRWHAEMIAGKSPDTICTEYQIGQTRFGQIIQLALLAPDLLDRIAAGTQPTSFTSQYVKTYGLPPEWDAQPALFNLLP